MPFCSNCGTQNPDEARFCSACGRSLAAAPAPPPPPPVNPVSPAGPKPSGMVLAHIGFWGCLLILGGFFAPWLNLGFFGSISGYDIVTSARGIINSPDDTGISVFILVTAIVIVLAAAICLLYLVGLGIGRGAFILFKLVPLLAFIVEIVYIYFKARNTPDDLADAGLNALGVGLYMTLGGALLLAISRSKR